MLQAFFSSSAGLNFFLFWNTLANFPGLSPQVYVYMVELTAHCAIQPIWIGCTRLYNDFTFMQWVCPSAYAAALSTVSNNIQSYSA